jgi:7,8-dihydropterin-6-yl-methyl-4-(beta-D-ribofuranosyl)aminobenzene 5'-phosphate synthase
MTDLTQAGIGARLSAWGAPLRLPLLTSRHLCSIAAVVLALSIAWPPILRAAPAAAESAARITVVYDNVAYAPGLRTDWGFAALVETADERVLFDTGAKGGILLANLARLGIEPKSIDAVVLSHHHGDHTGGLKPLLAEHPNVTVYIPQSFGAAFERDLQLKGALVETVSGPRRLRANVYTTGELGATPPEHALIIDVPNGLVVLTGCAHPGVVEIAGAARAYRGRDVELLAGGFHLHAQSPTELRHSLQALRDLGVRRVAPSHCTGKQASARFRELWGEQFVPSGCGAVIETPAAALSWAR